MGLALRRPMEAGNWYPPPMLAAYGAAAGNGNMKRIHHFRLGGSIDMLTGPLLKKLLLRLTTLLLRLMPL